MELYMSAFSATTLFNILNDFLLKNCVNTIEYKDFRSVVQMVDDGDIIPAIKYLRAKCEKEYDAIININDSFDNAFLQFIAQHDNKAAICTNYIKILPLKIAKDITDVIKTRKIRY